MKHRTVAQIRDEHRTVGHLDLTDDAFDRNLAEASRSEVATQASRVIETIGRREPGGRNPHPPVLLRDGNRQLEVWIQLYWSPDDEGEATAISQDAAESVERPWPIRQELHGVAADHRIHTGVIQLEVGAIHLPNLDIGRAGFAHVVERLLHHHRRGIDGDHTARGSHALRGQQGGVAGPRPDIEDVTASADLCGIEHPPGRLGHQKGANFGSPFPGLGDIRRVKRTVGNRHSARVTGVAGGCLP